jgi:peptide deformylase
MLAGGAGLLTFPGCLRHDVNEPCPVRVFQARWRLSPREERLIRTPEKTMRLVVREGPDSWVLRAHAREVPSSIKVGHIAERMEQAMRTAGGVGLAAPQVGLSLRLATLMLDYKTDHPRVIFVVNPVIVQRSESTIGRYEGCLSIPGVGGLVRRSAWIRVQHMSPSGATITEEATGDNAVLWQHELDHLDGILFVDKVLGPLLPMEEVRRRRKELEHRAKET